MLSMNTNAAQISAELERIANDLPAKIAGCVEKACFSIEAKAKEECPVRTGELRRSIMSDVSTDGTAIEGKVGTNLDYAPYERAESKLSKIGENLKRRKAIWKEMKKDSLFRNAKILQAKNLVA